MIRAGGDPAAAARQHRPPGRRHHGAARPRLDPGLDRHPDALRPAARLPADAARRREGELDARGLHRRRTAPTRGWWSNFDKYIVSLLKAWFGDAATAENDYGFGRLPKITGNHSHFPTMLRALDGGLDGLFVMGQNPAVGSQHAGLQRRALAELKWLVVRDLAEIETATFWRDSPEVARRRAAHRGHPDRGLPDARRRRTSRRTGTSPTRSGCCSGATRRSTRPATRARELWFMHHLAKRVQGALRRTRRASATGRSCNLTWDYPEHGEHRASPTPRPCCKEINGYDVATGEPVDRLRRARRTTASTACGCWIYSGVFADGVNQARRREPGDLDAAGRLGLARVGVGVAGQPPHPLQPRLRRPRGQAVVGAQEATSGGTRSTGKWTGYDVPDFPVDKAPGLPRRRRTPRAWTRSRGDDPFIMMADGTRLAVRAQRPARRAAADALRAARVAGAERCSTPRSARNPAALTLEPRRTTRARRAGDPRYPLVATTFRLTEHHTAGGDEPQPAVAGRAAAGDVRRDRPDARRRARDRGRRLDGDRRPSARRSRRAPSVTDRMRPLRVDGRTIHQVALPWHWGYSGPVPGDSANDLGRAVAATRTSRSRRTRRSPATCAPAGATARRPQKLAGVPRRAAHGRRPTTDAAGGGPGHA